METVYVRINWQNQPSTATALGATNLNKIDLALSIIDGRVVAINTTKLDVSVANTLVQDVTVDGNGVFTIKKLDGTTAKYDTKLEKIAVNFTYDSATQKIVITLDDGTKQYVDLSSLITEYEFTDSSTIDFTITEGKVSASVKNGSIKETHLQPNYLADIKVHAQNAQNSANASADSASLAKRYSIGIDAVTEKDSAKYFMEQAKQYRDEAQDISGVGIAGETKLGLVKGGGNVEIESDGDMWADPYKEKGTETGTFINFKNADDALAQINAKGITTATPTNPDLPISPDNKLILSNAVNFDVVSCGDNIAPKPTEVRTMGGVTFTPQPDGSIILNGTATGIGDYRVFTSTSADYNVAKVLLEKGKSYKCSFESDTTTPRVTLYVSFKDPNGDNLYYDQKSVITPEQNVFISSMFIRLVVGVSYDKVRIYPKLGVGTVATPYTPYKEDRINIAYPLRSVPSDICDVLDLASKKLTQSVGEYIITGNEAWSTRNTSNDIYMVINCDNLNIPNYDPNYNSTNKNSLCTHFQVKLIDSNVNEEFISLRASGKGFIISILRTRLATNDLAGAISYLKEQYSKSTPVTILYPIASPITTDVSLQNTYLKTFKGVTNIFTNATPQPEITATFKPQLWAALYNHQNAIESKIDDKKRVNNLLSTDPTTVLSGPMGKLLKEDIDALVKQTGITDARGTNKKPSEYPKKNTTTEFNNSTDIGLPVVNAWQCIVETSSPWTDLTGALVQKAFGFDQNLVYKEYVRRSNAEDTWEVWQRIDNSYVEFSIDSYTTLADLGNALRNNKDKTGIGRIGTLDNTLLKTLIPNPSGFGNYTRVSAQYVSNTVRRLIAVGLAVDGCVAESLMYHNDLGWQWTGWNNVGRKSSVITFIKSIDQGSRLVSNNGIVTLNFSARASEQLAVDTWVEVGKIPNTYAPKNVIYGIALNATGRTMVEFTVTVGGSLQVRSSTAIQSSHWISINVAYDAL